MELEKKNLEYIYIYIPHKSVIISKMENNCCALRNRRIYVSVIKSTK